MSIRANTQKLLTDCSRSKLVAVTKNRSIAEIKEAIAAGITVIGENKIQEAELKYNELKEILDAKKIEFHFIGHLQTNKAKKAVEMFDVIQSVDSFILAKEIDKRAAQANKIQKILLQINIGKEEQKSGVLPEETLNSVKDILQLTNISMIGLMCILPYSKKTEDSRSYFKKMKSLFDNCKSSIEWVFQGVHPMIPKKHQFDVLSMGMTNDYKVAIEEGSTMIRIGRGIFGERE
ncbi:MAG: YggS family pyridoxal phosphate-dependent enzyme [archaeon]